MTVDELVAAAVNAALEREAGIHGEVLRRAWALSGLRRGRGLERWHAYLRAHDAWVEARRRLDVLEHLADATGLDECGPCGATTGRRESAVGVLYCSDWCEEWDYRQAAVDAHNGFVVAGMGLTR